MKLDFLYLSGYVKRAGIIPFMIDGNGNTYVLLGLSKELNPVWADLGGRAEKGETTLETALREYGEESRWVISPDLSQTKGIVMGKDQVILFIQMEPNEFNINIDNKFQNTVPTSQYEDEMQYLRWIPYKEFLTMSNLSESLIEIQKILLNFWKL